MVSTPHPDTGPGRGGPGVCSGSLIACPECELPAEITDHFWLQSTDGPVLHICVTCVDGHYLRMPADRRPASLHVLSASVAGVGFSRLPGRLGTVRNPLPDEVRDESATASLP
jgi:hypothetical protein